MSGEQGQVDVDDVLMVQQAVSTLPPELREAVLLYYFSGWSVEEIATLTGVSRSTVWRRIRRALGRLRSSVGSGGTDDR